MHSILCPKTHHDTTIVEVDGMVENIKNDYLKNFS